MIYDIDGNSFFDFRDFIFPFLYTKQQLVLRFTAPIKAGFSWTSNSHFAVTVFLYQTDNRWVQNNAADEINRVSLVV